MGKRLYDSLKDVPYQGAVYQIRNNLYPFLLDEVKGWPCGNSDITAQLLVANEDRFLAKWLAGRNGRAGRASLPESDVVGRAARPAPSFSPEAQAVMGAAKSLSSSIPMWRCSNERISDYPLYDR